MLVLRSSPLPGELGAARSLYVNSADPRYEGPSKRKAIVAQPRCTASSEPLQASSGRVAGLWGIMNS